MSLQEKNLQKRREDRDRDQMSEVGSRKSEVRGRERTEVRCRKSEVRKGQRSGKDRSRPGEMRSDKLNATRCDSVNLTRQAVTSEFHRAGRTEVGRARDRGRKSEVGKGQRSEVGSRRSEWQEQETEDGEQS